MEPRGGRTARPGLVGEALHGEGARALGALGLLGEGQIRHALETAHHELGVVAAATDALHGLEGPEAGGGKGGGLVQGGVGALGIAFGFLRVGQLVQEQGAEDRVPGGPGAQLQRGAAGDRILSRAGRALEGEGDLGALRRLAGGLLQQVEGPLRVLLAGLDVDREVDQRRAPVRGLLRAADGGVVEAREVVEGAASLEEPDQGAQRRQVAGRQVVGGEVALDGFGRLLELLVEEADPPAQQGFSPLVGLGVRLLAEHLKPPRRIVELCARLALGARRRGGGRIVRWRGGRLRHRGFVHAHGLDARESGARGPRSGRRPYQRSGAV